MNAVSNASPLITLAKGGLVNVLRDLYGTVIVPEAVLEEINAGPEDDAIRGMIGELGWLRIVRLDPPLTRLAALEIGRGEAEVIECAVRNIGYEAILDDRTARRIATAFDVPVRGTIGVLAKAASVGVIPSFDEAIERIKAAGLYFNAEVVEEVKKSLRQRK